MNTYIFFELYYAPVYFGMYLAVISPTFAAVGVGIRDCMS